MFNPNPVNNPTLRGQKAGEVETIGANGRYDLFPVHTRFDAVAWFIEDRETLDAKGLADVVVQADSRRAALDKLARIRPGYDAVIESAHSWSDYRESAMSGAIGADGYCYSDADPGM